MSCSETIDAIKNAQSKIFHSRYDDNLTVQFGDLMTRFAAYDLGEKLGEKLGSHLKTLN